MCRKITDQGLQYLANDFSALTSSQLKGVHTIDLDGCYEITDQGLQYLEGVHTVSLHDCIKITV